MMGTAHECESRLSPAVFCDSAGTKHGRQCEGSYLNHRWMSVIPEVLPRAVDEGAFDVQCRWRIESSAPTSHILDSPVFDFSCICTPLFPACVLQKPARSKRSKLLQERRRIERSVPVVCTACGTM